MRLQKGIRPFAFQRFAPGERASGTLQHLGYALATRAEVDAAAAHAREAGLLRVEPHYAGPIVGYFCIVADPDGNLVEMIELPEHPWFVATQFHPELKSRPSHPHPLFASFIAAAARRRDEQPATSAPRQVRLAGAVG